MNRDLLRAARSGVRHVWPTGMPRVVIAHRLAAIRDADRIVVVDDTGVAEQGRHGDLIAAGGKYHRLHEAQHGA